MGLTQILMTPIAAMLAGAGVICGLFWCMWKIYPTGPKAGEGKGATKSSIRFLQSILWGMATGAGLGFIIALCFCVLASFAGGTEKEEAMTLAMIIYPILGVPFGLGAGLAIGVFRLVCPPLREETSTHS